MTQKSKILGLLRERGEQGVMAWELPEMHILQYNSRIKELREKGFLIENKDSVFRLISEPMPVQESLII